MTFNDISQLRLINQQIVSSQFTNAVDLVNWMGAMQAQDFSMAKIGVGLRVPHLTEKMINDAFDDGKILRTHLMRPTWHLVSADDIYWLLALTAPRIKGALGTRHKQLELDKDIITKSLSIVEKALEQPKFLTREALGEKLTKEGITINNNRLSHLLFYAELESLVCSGTAYGSRQTYALLEKQVPIKNLLSKEESLALLVKKYFQSHGPATMADFMWWSGLNTRETKMGIEMNKENFVSEKIENVEYWFVPSNSDKKLKDSVFLLPAFDEFIISYKDRRAFLPDQHYAKAISINGIFRPVVLLNGYAVGIWSRISKPAKVLFEVQMFKPLKKVENLLGKEMVKMEGFLGKKVELKILK